MTEIAYLAYLPDPFGISAARYAIMCRGDLRLVSAEELVGYSSSLVTYEVPSLLDELRRARAEMPPALIDVSDAIRLCSGVARDQGGEKKWDIWRTIHPIFPNLRIGNCLLKSIRSRVPRPSDTEMQRLLFQLCQALASLWEGTSARMEALQESERFLTIELPSARIFYARQYYGICVNKSEVDRNIDDAYRKSIAHTQKLVD